MSQLMRRFERGISEAFAGRDFAEAHAKAALILREMGEDTRVLHEILAENLKARDFFERARINPVLALNVGADRNYSLLGHCWIPLDDGRTDLTHQSVHHHGKLLLTSMSAWGQGYESVLFKSGFEVDRDSGRTRMEIDKVYKNPKGHLEFVDAHTPHVVFFPETFTVTYALWSQDRPQAGSYLKRLPWLQSYKKRIRTALTRLGLASGLGLNPIRDLDFYPSQGRLIRMRDRVNYAPGGRSNFLTNYFWCLQQSRFDRLGEVSERIRAQGGHPEAAALLRRLERGEPIERRMEPIHLGVERVQFTREELMACFSRRAEVPGDGADAHSARGA